MTLNYLCTLPLPDEWFAQLRARVPGLIVHRMSADAPPPPEILEQVEVLHTSEWFPEMAQVPHLRGIQLDTSGVDHLQHSALWHSTIPIATLGGIAPVPMAEYAMMQLLALAHHLPAISQLRERRSWPTAAERLAALTPRELRGATLGIIGYGRIGREIARLAAAFGIRVLGLSRSGEPDADSSRGELFQATTHPSDPRVPPEPSAQPDAPEIFPRSQLDLVLSRSDMLIVVVPLTELTRGMIGARELDLLPAGASVINIARGGIVDEVALLQRLRSGHLSGVALDVFDTEPLPESSEWWREPGAIITPHIAGLSPNYQEQTLELLSENLRRVAERRPLLNEVNRVTAY